MVKDRDGEIVFYWAKATDSPDKTSGTSRRTS
jgi:hypothetical protein